VHVGIAQHGDEEAVGRIDRDAASLDLEAIRRELEVLKAGVAARTIAADKLRGGTITLSNFGTLGGIFAALVVVPPQVAILGAGRIAERAAVRDGRATARRLLPLSLTFDHRAVSGGEAARFLSAVRAALEEPPPTP
jgi:pyruvate dehydrogenase E2 component (dihydrolipoamide acetyltransferase)